MEKQECFNELLESKILYFIENINAIEVSLKMGWVDIEEIMLNIIYLNYGLEVTNKQFASFNTESFKCVTAYSNIAEHYEAVLSILFKIINFAEYDLNKVENEKQKEYYNDIIQTAKLMAIKIETRDIENIKSKISQTIDDQILSKIKKNG